MDRTLNAYLCYSGVAELTYDQSLTLIIIKGLPTLGLVYTRRAEVYKRSFGTNSI